MPIDVAISNSWAHAAIDLGIRVVAPVELRIDGGRTIQLEARVLDFGSPSGTLAATELSLGMDSDKLRRKLRDLGYWYSVLFPCYRVYKRQLSIETLDDWQWCGLAGAAPAWYTGRSWS
ncbi:MAG: hypothetical protein KGJ78_02105 [Alphaproteobacteria bacterium]|nr:hypothetical protein [Alphaproteobacteria bacterium]